LKPNTHNFWRAGWRGWRAAAAWAVAAGLLAAAPARAQSVVWANNGSDNLNLAGNWIGGNLPTGSQIASFVSAAFSPNPLHLTSQNLTVLGLRLEAGAGALNFSSAGSGGAKTIVVGSAGIVNASTNTLQFDISTKVNLALAANAAFTADGTILIMDTSNSVSGLDLGAFTLTLGGASTGSIIAKGFTGTGSLIKSGTGTWTLTGANSYTGATTLSGGVLAVSTLANGGSASNLGASSAAAANLVFDGGTLRYTGGAGSTNRLFTLTAGGGTLEASGTGALIFGGPGSIAFAASTISPTLVLAGSSEAVNTFAPVLGDSGAGVTSLTKTDTGRWALAGLNTLSGTVTVAAGNLLVNSGAALGSSSVAVVVNGGTLTLNSSSQTIAALSGTGGTIELGSGHVLTVNPGGATTYAGAIAGSGGLSKTGAGTLTFGGVTTFTGPLSLLAGTLAVNNSGALPATASTVTIDGGLLDVNNTAQNIALLSLRSGALSGLSALKLTAAGSNWTGGEIRGTGSLTVASGADFAISGVVEHLVRGRAFVNEGTVNWSAGTLRTIDGATVTNKGTFNDTSGAAVTHQGTGTFTNTTTGTYVKSGASVTTFEMPVVNSGRININAGSVSFAGGYTSNGGTLGGTGGSIAFTTPVDFGGGTLSGSITLTAPSVTAGGLVSPGNSPGTLTINGDLTLLVASTLIVELRGPQQGVDYDSLYVTGQAVLGGGLSLAFLNGYQNSVQSTDTFTIVTAGTLVGAFSNVAPGQRLFTSDNFGSFQVNYGVGSAFGSNQVVLSNFIAVPEPSTWHLLSAGLLVGGFLWYRRRGR
jgi:fibronectin-binding autotransporter adhesin